METPPPTRRRTAFQALLYSALFVGFGSIITWTTYGQDPAGWLIVTGLTFPVISAGTYGLLRLELRERTWWRSRHPVAPPPSSGRTVPFVFRGSARRQSVVLVVAFAALALTSLILPFPEALTPPLASAFRILFVVAFGFAAFAGVAMSLPRTVQVDDLGVRVERPLGGSFQSPWNDIAEVGIVPVVAPLLTSVGGRRTPTMVVFRGKVKTALGSFAPSGEMGPDQEGAFLEAVRSFATRYGVPVRNVTMRELWTWRKRFGRAS